MIPELEEHAERHNSDNVDTRRDQYGSDEETTIMFAHQPCPFRGLIFLHVVPFTGDCRVKIPLSVTHTPFHGYVFFLDNDLINLCMTETNQYAHQYLNTVGLHTLETANTHTSQKIKMWAYLRALSMTGIGR
jgi:hypothetical protein